MLTYFLGGSRGRGRGGGPNNRLKFDSEFDFETSNQQFNKEDIERELKEKLTISSSPAAGQYFAIYLHCSYIWYSFPSPGGQIVRQENLWHEILGGPISV